MTKPYSRREDENPPAPQPDKFKDHFPRTVPGGARSSCRHQGRDQVWIIRHRSLEFLLTAGRRCYT
jgi:hypothetical protein